MNDRVRPESPVRCRPETVLVQGASFQKGLPSRQRRQQKLTLLRDEEALEVRRVDLEQRVPFSHGCGVARHREPQQPGFVPHFDRLDERSGRELTAPDGAHAGPLNPGANGIGDARAEEPVVRRVKVGEADNMPPDVLGRGVDHHRRLAGEEQGLGLRDMFGAHHRRQQGEQDDHELAEIAGWFGSKFQDEISDQSAEDHDRRGERQHHDDADQPFKSGRNRQDYRREHPEHGDPEAVPPRDLSAEAINHDRKHRQHERKTDEQAPSVVSKDMRAEIDHRRGDRQGDQDRQDCPLVEEAGPNLLRA